MYSLNDIRLRDVVLFQTRSTIAKEIQCYSLPYGELGFLSHILTFYTVVMLYKDRSPLRPWKRLSHSFFDQILAMVGLAGGFVLTLITLVRCRRHWQLLLLGLSKLCTSLMNGLSGIALVERIERVRRTSPGGHSGGTMVADLESERVVREIEKGMYSVLGFALYTVLFGTTFCLTGVISLVAQHWGMVKVQIITYVFISTVTVLAITAFYVNITASEEERRDDRVNLTLPITFVVGPPLYADWILGVVTGNLLGVPSGDSAGLYWSYFVLKRLTTLSS